MIQLFEFCIFAYIFSYLPGYFVKYCISLLVFYFFEKYQTKFVRKYLNIEIAKGMDLIFAYESKQNQSLILACSIIDQPFDESFKDLVIKSIEKEKKYHKLKEKIHKNALFAYWTLDKSFNYDNHFQFFDQEVHEERELYKIMGDELSTPFSNAHPKWKFFVFKNYQGNKGAAILKFHHTYVDGISMVSFFLKTSELENVKFVNMPKISPWKWAYIYLTLIFTAPYYLYINAIKRTDKNKIHDFELSGKKRAFSLQISKNLTELKAISKKLRISINDFFTSVLMDSLSSYYQDKFHEPFPEDTVMFMPVTLRPLPPPGVTCPLDNTMIPLFVNMKMFRGEDKEKVAKNYGKRLLSIKNSLEAPSLFLLIHYFPKILPIFIFDIIFDFLSVKPSFGFTNVPGPLEKLTYKGNVNVEKIFFYVPTVSRIGLGFSLFTYNNNLMFGVQSDERTGVDPEEFTQYYQKNMDIYIQQALERSPMKEENEKKKE